jgi:hypothetical protein
MNGVFVAYRSKTDVDFLSNEIEVDLLLYYPMGLKLTSSVLFNDAHHYLKGIILRVCNLSKILGHHYLVYMVLKCTILDIGAKCWGTIRRILIVPCLEWCIALYGTIKILRSLSFPKTKLDIQCSTKNLFHGGCKTAFII